MNDHVEANGAHKRQPFALGILQSFTPPAWLASDDRLHGGDWWDGDYYVETTKRLEDAEFDFVFYHDTLAVQRRSDGSMDAALRWAATAPAHDPLCLLPVLGRATDRIGLLGTASTTFSNPYQVARTFSTLDSLTRGRIGWNIVTSFEGDAAANFGLDVLPDHSERYDRADEFVEVTKKLWNAWEEGAVIADLESDTYVDASKVHSVDHVGKHFRSRGPLNTQRSPQVVPFLAQAGASPRGRDFAAKHAEFVFAVPGIDVDAAREIREDLRRRAELAGRDPDDLMVVFGCNVAFEPDDWDPEVPVPVTDAQFYSQLEWWSASINFDLATLPLDEPIPADLPGAGITSMFQTLAEMGRMGKTLRQSIESFAKSRGGFRGTPEQVAGQMMDFMDAVGGDGIMLTREWEYNAAFLDAATDRMAPALVKAGVIGTETRTGNTLRARMRSIRHG
ncbi:MAG TPA: NtaA/DmoA family FMN-dependent monooxygenase [Baekduia sp.]|nr:NtaA/DmoA family FMN-dependent monooxygenase [Baekduia sp.]